MDRKTATIVGAAAALVAAPALATPNTAPVAPAASYAELLDPIPNAVERLRIADAQDAAQPPRLIKAQYDAHHHHHHHHHHSHHNRRWYHQHGYVWLGGAWVLRPPPRHHHHHHHHHHNNF